MLWIENGTLQGDIFRTFAARLGSNSKSVLGAGRQSGPVSLAGRRPSHTSWECIQHISALMCQSCLQLNQGGVHLFQSQRKNVYESAATLYEPHRPLRWSGKGLLSVRSKHEEAAFSFPVSCSPQFFDCEAFHVKFYSFFDSGACLILPCIAFMSFKLLSSS